jgi:hypothetical protein
VLAASITALTIEAENISEESVNFCQTTQCNNSKNSYLHTCHCKNLKPHFLVLFKGQELVITRKSGNIAPSILSSSFRCRLVNTFMFQALKGLHEPKFQYFTQLGLRSIWPEAKFIFKYVTHIPSIPNFLLWHDKGSPIYLQSALIIITINTLFFQCLNASNPWMNYSTILLRTSEVILVLEEK